MSAEHVSKPDFKLPPFLFYNAKRDCKILILYYRMVEKYGAKQYITQFAIETNPVHVSC